MEYVSDTGCYKGWFPESYLKILDGLDSSLSLAAIFDSDSDTGGGGSTGGGNSSHQPPNNGGSLPRRNHGTNFGSSDSGGAHPPNNGASFGSSNSGGHNVTHHNVSKDSGPEDLKSEESDQSEGNVVSDDDEEGSSVADPEGDWSELVNFYTALIIQQLLREISGWRTAIESGESAPKESICARDGYVAAEPSSPCNAVPGPKINTVDTTPELKVCVLGRKYR